MLATFCRIGKLPVTRLVSLNQTELSSTAVARAVTRLTRSIVSHDRRMIVMVKLRVGTGGQERVVEVAGTGVRTEVVALLLQLLILAGAMEILWQRPWRWKCGISEHGELGASLSGRHLGNFLPLFSSPSVHSNILQRPWGPPEWGRSGDSWKRRLHGVPV